jgi:hypothetical protein
VLFLYTGAEGDRQVEVFVLRGGKLSIGLTVRGPFKAAAQSIGHPSTAGATELDVQEDVTTQEEVLEDPTRFGDNYVYRVSSAVSRQQHTLREL